MCPFQLKQPLVGKAESKVNTSQENMSCSLQEHKLPTIEILQSSTGILKNAAITDRCPRSKMIAPLTLGPFSKLLLLPVLWGPFGPHCPCGLPIHEYVTYNKNITCLGAPGSKQTRENGSRVNSYVYSYVCNIFQVLK